jgi:hypothetical protein
MVFLLAVMRVCRTAGSLESPWVVSMVFHLVGSMVDPLDVLMVDWTELLMVGPKEPCSVDL